MNREYPEYILKILRESVGINKTDTQHDEEFNTWSANEVFDSVMRYEMDPNPIRVKDLIIGIYGIDLDKINAN
jgi:hypothetical protein